MVIEKKTVDFDRFYYVCMAREKNDYRGFTNCISIEKENDSTIGVCTNGRSLHKTIFIEDYENGVYNIERLTKSTIELKKVVIGFPNWKRVVPEEYDNTFTIEFESQVCKLNAFYKGFFTNLKTDKTIFVNHDYLIPFFDSAIEPINVYMDNTHARALKLISGGNMLVVMPMEI